MRDELRLPPTLSMSEAQSLYGVSARALRLYDEWGLLRASRDDQNRRYFDCEARRRLDWIVRLRAVGLSIPDIRQVLAADPKSRSDVAIALAKLDLRRMEVAEQLAAIDGYRRSLRLVGSAPERTVPEALQRA